MDSQQLGRFEIRANFLAPLLRRVRHKRSDKRGAAVEHFDTDKIKSPASIGNAEQHFDAIGRDENPD